MSRFFIFSFVLLSLYFISVFGSPATASVSPVAVSSAPGQVEHHGKQHHHTEAPEHHGKHHDGKHYEKKAAKHAQYHNEDYANTRVELDSDSLSDDDDDEEIERDCGFFDHWELRKTLSKVVCSKSESDCGSRAFPGGKVGSATNGGFGTNVWLSVVNRAGRVCAVIHSGDHFDDQWVASRVISAQKASTANGFSLDEFALSTANLQTATTVGSLQGLTDSNPANPTQAYSGTIKHWGESCTPDDDDDDEDMDPLCGFRLGGTVTFGGGLALYNKDGDKVGALGVSGETACADHVIAWRVRNLIKLDYVPSGPVAGSDAICLVGQACAATTGFTHNTCGVGNEVSVINALPVTRQP